MLGSRGKLSKLMIGGYTQRFISPSFLFVLDQFVNLAWLGKIMLILLLP
jgi:hypothetical protein